MTREHANTTRANDGDGEPVRYTVLSRRTIALWAVLIVAAGAGMAVWLLLAYTGGDANRLQLDAIRTAGTIVVGTGGAAALLLAARRQRTAEIALKQKDRDQADVTRAHALQERVAVETRAHQERVAAATEHDAAERRVTELYTAAAAQLGSDKAPVRLAGLYALERLAQNNPEQRQTIVNVLCAYLRMPCALPEGPPVDPSDEGHILRDRPAAQVAHNEWIQEREVRLTAQRVLTAHLRPRDVANPAETFWADADLDLTGAVLINVDLRRCHLRTAQFTDAKFAGDTSFDNARFADDASFNGVEFAGRASFGETRFADRVSFATAHFADRASFTAARFADRASFSSAHFAGDASFDAARFAERVLFDETRFAGETLFGGVDFAGRAWFPKARFAGRAWFVGAQFVGDASFGRAEFLGHVCFDRARFAGDALFGGEDASFPDGVSFRAAVFERGVPSEVRRLWSPPRTGQAANPPPDPAVDGRSG